MVTRAAWMGALLVALGAALGTAACGPTSGGGSCTQKCHDTHFDCVECCELLTGSVRNECMTSCGCQETCCLDSCGAVQPGECASCQENDPGFTCDPALAVDNDGDGFNHYTGDCNDNDPAVNPDAQEVANGIDDNCDGNTDSDLDNDGFTTEDGDCDDNDPYVSPMVPEICEDGIDNNCNGMTDADEPDGDGDGWGPCGGDCNDAEALINPGAIEDETDEVDNDCDGEIDEPRATCSGGQYPELEAMEICNPNIIQSVQTVGDGQAMGVIANFGAINPRTTTSHPSVENLLEQNDNFLILCTGPAASTDPQQGTDLGGTDSDPMADANLFAYDLLQLEVTFEVPMNVQGFSFDFIYLSSEYPEWVCTEYNDTFYAIEESASLNGGQSTNISFDSNGDEITVNNNFFEDPGSWTQDLSGTGYDGAETFSSCNGSELLHPGCEMPDPCPPNNSTLGSATGWLRTTSPVEPGEVMTLTFSIHDEGDNVWDSCVVLDNFRWTTTPVEGPGTVK